MFNSDFKESQLNSVQIADFEVDVVKAMLRYMYTAKLPNLPNLAVDLLKAADKVIHFLIDISKYEIFQLSVFFFIA